MAHDSIPDSKNLKEKSSRFIRQVGLASLVIAASLAWLSVVILLTIQKPIFDEPSGIMELIASFNENRPNYIKVIVAIIIDLAILLLFKNFFLRDRQANYLILRKEGYLALFILLVFFTLNYTVFQHDSLNLIPLFVLRFMIYFPVP